ncbi:hypothetical protein CU097_008121 [Rhizopus azygosporus]|uniref:Uncharacterized protein n=1 Tax=Rhizopus azygosporus TaxID=86630 RepID=A0A367JA13_RHIAZ|nr:hypothetical protein CU097_008121 [Rhizopus azygosporus]
MNTKQADLTVGEFAKRTIPSKLYNDKLKEVLILNENENEEDDDADGRCDEGKYNDDKDEAEEVEEVDDPDDEAVDITENEGDYQAILCEQ